MRVDERRNPLARTSPTQKGHLMDIDTHRFHARSMRKNMTGAERKLWVALRNRGLGGHKFQRQAEIGPYIVGFLCRERAVIIEIDGDTHSSDLEVARDRQRSAFLEANGYAVFRGRKRRAESGISRTNNNHIAR